MAVVGLLAVGLGGPAEGAEGAALPVERLVNPAQPTGCSTVEAMLLIGVVRLIRHSLSSPLDLVPISTSTAAVPR